MRGRRDVRVIVLDMLDKWGEWERLGMYAAAAQRSMLGTLMKDGPGCGGGSPAGSRLPAGLAVPGDVLLMGRMVAEMRANCRAGEAYHRAIRAKFVCGGQIDNRALLRAVDRLMQLFLSRACASGKNMV